MDDELKRWKSYFYPPPNDAALRNLAGIKNPGALRQFEYSSAMNRQEELAAMPHLIPRTFDADHVKAIHRHLFQDVYEWAGEFRRVDMSKGNSLFASIDGGIDRYLEDVASRVSQIDWIALGQTGFAVRAAAVFGMLNKAHPFREGNGRTSKVFMRHVAELSRFDLRFDRVEPGTWNAASAASITAPGKFLIDPEPLIPVMLQATVRRRGEGSRALEATRRLFNLVMPTNPPGRSQPSEGPEERPPTQGPVQGLGRGPRL